MKVTINQEENKYSVTLEGRVDTTNADQFQKDVAVLMEAPQPDIEIDCSAMEYTSSQGLRVFLQLQKNVTAHQGKLVPHGCSRTSRRSSTSPVSPTSSRSCNKL